MTTNKILGNAVGLGSLSLVGRSAKLVKDSCPGSKLKSKGQGKGLGKGMGKGPRGKPTKLVRGYVDLTVGTALLTPSAAIVNKF